VLNFGFRNTNGRFPDRRTGFFDNGLVFVGALRLGNSPLDYPTSFLRAKLTKAGAALKGQQSSAQANHINANTCRLLPPARTIFNPLNL
jgi:hypothetical protein